MRKIYFFFLFISTYSNAQISQGLTGIDPVISSQPLSLNSNADIDCTEGSFWSIRSNGPIIRWNIAGGVITYSDTVFQNSPINSIAHSGNLNSASIPRTFYGSDGHDLIYFNGTSWDSIGTPQNLNWVGNCGGYQNFLFYTAITPNGGGLPSEIYRYDGTNFTQIVSLGTNRNLYFETI